MNGKRMRGGVLVLAVVVLSACGGEKPIDIKAIMSKPKTFVGSDTCKMCHLEHYDSWKMTLHSRMLQDVNKNRDAVIVPIDEKEIQEDLKKLGQNLKVPVEKIYIPQPSAIKYTVGSQWSQRYVVEKDGKLYIAPIQYNAETHNWEVYHEDDWDQRPFLPKCGGCHATGVDLDKETFVEPGVSCEACHGRGSWHAALPKVAVFEKRQTIVNPAKLTMGVSVQICASCHSRGEVAQHKGAEWPVGYEPGRALEAYYRLQPYTRNNVENIKETYAEEFSRGHHQQYNDWMLSQHFVEGVTCTSCHYVHQLGIPSTRVQTIAAGSRQCLECHELLNKTAGHAIHSFANCIGCHMPRIAVSEETGKTHSHVSICLTPKDTLDNPAISNSCQACHKHKKEDLKELQEKAFPGSMVEGGW